MKKPKDFLFLTLFMAGILAAILAVVISTYSNWSTQREQPSPQQVTSQMDKRRSADPSGQAATGSGHTHQLQNAVPAGKTVKHTGNFPVVNFLLPSFDPDKLYDALTSLDPTEAYQAIETVSQHAEALYKFDVVYRLITELCMDDDPYVAEGAQYARMRMMSLRAAHEIPEPLQFYEFEEWPNGAYMTWSQDILETVVEPLDTLQERALFDPDPAVRLGGIEAAISQEDENSFGLLRDAALYDFEPDNRLTAVSELEQMLRNGLGDRKQILQLLKETAMDSDLRVAELSELIIQEQFGGPKKLPQHDENEEIHNYANITRSKDILETALEPLDILQERAIVDPDPAVRLGGIEAAHIQKDRAGFDLLSEAALYDYEPDNRLSAVSGLEQMLKSGLGARQQILQLLKKTAMDSDPRVAELSELIIREQRNQ